MTETATTPEGVPVITADPFTQENLSEPNILHEQLREAGSVVYLDAYGIWGMARYEQVNAALKDWKTYSSAAGVGLSDFRKEKPWRPPSLLLEADPPAHTRAREVVGPVLSPRAMEALREPFEREAALLVERLAAQRSFDAVTELSEAYPLKVFGDAVGLPEEGREHLMAYGNMAFNAFGPRNQLLENSMVGAQAVQQWIAESCRREMLRPGGFGAQIWAVADTGKIPEEWAALLVRSLLTAGIDTTVNGIAAAIYGLASNPEQWSLLRENPSLAASAFEEAVRWESPVQTFFRTTTREVEVDGVHIPAGEKVLLFLGAANRDPRHWSNPERFDIKRNASGHVGFGMGVHRCVGQTVARVEAEIVLKALARRVERMEISGQPRRRPNNTLHAWSSLPVTVYAAG
ncbi:MAG TPA: cytochrome P450 [Ktedonobacteraceae bacterium]|nr:cytochrome P450 [Ktedonobacteraceae bacterium]